MIYWYNFKDDKDYNYFKIIILGSNYDGDDYCYYFSKKEANFLLSGRDNK